MRLKPTPRLGGVYQVQDAVLTLPPNDQRRVHATRRPVVVVSGPRTNDDRNWLLVLVVPLSTSPAYATPLCVPLKRGQGNLTADTWARVSATQPLLKDALEDFSGILPIQQIQQIQGKLMVYMDLIDEE